MRKTGTFSIPYGIHRRKYFLKAALLLVSLVLFHACIDEYWPEINSYQNLLVVDGMINNGPGPVRVDLSLSTGTEKPEFIPLSGCEVTIEDNAGGTIILQEGEKGSYVSSGMNDAGVVGRSYKLSIITPSGKQYASEDEELLAPASIDSVYPQLENKMDPDYDYELQGYQFYVDTRAAGPEKLYYLWRLEQTYEYNADFYIHFIYDDATATPFNPIDSLFTCWITEKINKVFVYSTSGLTSPDLEAFPLNYVSTQSRALSVRYSLLVDQMTINETTFRYWDEVHKQNAGETSLYTQQLYQIRGNVKNISDDSEPVLGYFVVAGKDSRRIFVNRPTEIVDFYYQVCEIDEGDYDAYRFIRWTDRRTWPLYIYRDPNGTRALPPQECLDCRRKGGTTSKPEF